MVRRIRTNGMIGSRIKKKYGKIGSPKSAKRKAFLRTIRKKSKSRKKSGFQVCMRKQLKNRKFGSKTALRTAFKKAVVVCRKRTVRRKR